MTFIDNYNHTTWISFLIYIFEKNRGEEHLLNDFISYYNKNWIMLANNLIFLHHIQMVLSNKNKTLLGKLRTMIIEASIP